MAKPEKPKQGCFSGFIRVLLCSRNGTSPPVHPSDHVTEQDETEFVHSRKDPTFEDTDTTPGLVARLMGLESLLKTSFLIKGTTPDSVTRSRSVNFVDFMVNFDVVAGNGSHHRRAKTSASFREVPVPVPVPALAHSVQEENDLVVFCWDDGDLCKEQEIGFELRKMGIGFEEMKQGKKQGNKNKKEIISVKKERNNKKNDSNNNQMKNKKISKLKNEPRRVPCSNHGKKVRNQSEDKGFSGVSSSSKSSSSCSSSKLQNSKQQKKKEFVESCKKKRIRNEKLSKKMESDCNSENLSPVSVLAIGTNCLDVTNPLASKPKLKSSSILSFNDGVEHNAGNNKGFGCAYTDINKEAEYYSELFLKLQTLTEQDIREFDNTTKLKYDCEEFEEISFSFEHKILDLLLHEFVNELL